MHFLPIPAFSAFRANPSMHDGKMTSTYLKLGARFSLSPFLNPSLPPTHFKPYHAITFDTSLRFSTKGADFIRKKSNSETIDPVIFERLSKIFLWRHHHLHVLNVN
ncbi:hypothetical protein AMJ44_09960 [candidate division WOR-1 bacterium DG_54_3]|uniref:Uncharacterized protein n=1 Tax=candidate division WOR-1 bacterium DG_54_3 TaxID=1703775 RepID=A0A0S7XT71_UNCSA|nr:MAG: hypothetical protein AMJ44_09960 [candidate division WOR-1 bacterium DG_54_3]